MKQGYLSEYFKGVASKTLSAVEVDMSVSHQHEYNGVSALKKIFGTERKTFAAQFLYLNDEDSEPVTDTGFLTWYDARENHPTRSEFRMYFTSTAVSAIASAGDMIFICLKADLSVVVILAEGKSTICNQLKWLFDIEITKSPNLFAVRADFSHEQLNFVSKTILEQIGISIEYSEEFYLAEMIARFGRQFPKTAVFSAYARETLSEIQPLDNPDFVLIQWLEREEMLFKTFEKYLVSARLKEGFQDNVDEFFKFALSALNRRKSRAGHSLENHVETLLAARNIRYERGGITENRSKPDFLFPNSAAYHDKNFDAQKLTMLGVKSTCKDRWRQVLSEADRITEKHLLTLEAAISSYQLEEMRARNLQLVVPESIHQTYQENEDLMTVNDFIEMVAFRQRAFTF